MRIPWLFRGAGSDRREQDLGDRCRGTQNGLGDGRPVPQLQIYEDALVGAQPPASQQDGCHRADQGPAAHRGAALPGGLAVGTQHHTVAWGCPGCGQACLAIPCAGNSAVVLPQLVKSQMNPQASHK